MRIDRNGNGENGLGFGEKIEERRGVIYRGVRSEHGQRPVTWQDPVCGPRLRWGPREVAPEGD